MAESAALLVDEVLPHETDNEAVLFSFSDRSAQLKLVYWREQHG